MLRLFCVFCLATLIPVPQAFAQQDLICRKAKNTTRHYSIVVENAETGLPCSVVDRTNWKTPKVLWQAEYERTYCRNKIRDLVKRLKAQDWACTATNDRAGLRPVM
jgi:hypothetical protein